MARWFLFSLLIFIAVIDPSFGFFNFVGSFVKEATNVFGSIVGLGKFTEQSFEYAAKEVRDRTPRDKEEFDFIIVGAGSAGAAIAARLSEIAGWKILLLEAGGHEILLMDIPLAAIFLQLDKKIHWDYLSEPSNDYCRAIVNRQCRVPMGRIMGGTSVMNAMLAVRGNKHDYNEWAEITGDYNWSYEGMLPYFKKLETFHNDWVKYDEAYHNHDGPIKITNPPFRTPLSNAFVEAGLEMGFPSVDYNGPTQTGFNRIQTNLVNGERLSSNRAYLHPTRNRNNLVISLNSHVNKVLINPKTKTAYGVEFTKNGRKIEVIAKKEVIVSAGAMGSPKLLMLSGIGPKKHLEEMGINVLQDAPVGENLTDHVAYGGLIFRINQPVAIVVPDFLNPNNPTVTDYLNRRTGRLSLPSGIEGLAYVNVDNFKDPTDSPNIELMFGSITFVADYLIHVPFGITGKYWTDFYADSLNKHAWQVWPLLMKPKSRGKVLLRSSNPYDNPRILANYFTDPDDVRVSIKGIRAAIEVSKTKAMKRYGSVLIDRLVPGCENYKYDSDEYWECALRTYTITLWHHSGTCKMGTDDDTWSVVNTRLQVKGIKNLRVADASIMPNIVRAHINVPTMAIGEKFSDILKSEYLDKKKSRVPGY